MSSIVKTDAVVLRSMKYRETSRIVTLYTRRRGKVSGLVKGARRARSSFGPALDPMSFVSVIFYVRETREIQTIAQCDLIKQFRHLSEDLDAMAAGMAIVELMASVAHGEEENGPLFGLLVECLETLNEGEGPTQTLMHYFQIHLSSIMGFRPSFEKCVFCGRPPDAEGGPAAVRVHLGKGGPVCRQCSASHTEEAVSVSRGALRILGQLAGAGGPRQVLGIHPDRETEEELNGFIWSYLRRHLPGVRSLRSERVFSKLLAPS